MPEDDAWEWSEDMLFGHDRLLKDVVDDLRRYILGAVLGFTCYWRLSCLKTGALRKEGPRFY